jgi:hypothetical protein
MTVYSLTLFYYFHYCLNIPLLYVWYWKCLFQLFLSPNWSQQLHSESTNIIYHKACAYFHLSTGCCEGLLPQYTREVWIEPFLWLGLRRVRHLGSHPGTYIHMAFIPFSPWNFKSYKFKLIIALVLLGSVLHLLLPWLLPKNLSRRASLEIEFTVYWWP